MALGRTSTRPEPIPARAGIGLRACHHARVLAERPAIGWLEVHSENFFHDGPALTTLTRIRADYPLSLHGVGLSLGSTDPLDREHLARLGQLVERVSPALVSEHLSWGMVGGRHMNDLLPLPYTEDALRLIVARIQETQDYLRREILIENVSSYLGFACSEMSEWEFLSAVARQAGCRILLDVNNIFVSSRNHGFDPLAYITGIPRGIVGEIHLAGHSVQQLGTRELLVDTHGARVSAAVWQLFGAALERFGPTPTLIEWDTDVPALEVLLDEAQRAEMWMEARDGLAA